MEKSILKYQLFDLSGEKFEELCADLLNAEYQFDKFFITAGPNDKGVDILAISGIKKIAIQIKHRYKIGKKQLEEEIEKYKPLLEFHHEFIYITSANLPKEIINSTDSAKIKILAQDDIIKLLEKHPDVGQRYFTIAEKKKKRNREWLYLSLVGGLISLIISLSTLYSEFQSNDEPLAKRIDNVEQALKGIKGLENDLESIKSDMIKTDLENKKILEEYEKMKGLEDIVNEKKKSLNIILNYEPWHKKALNYFLGIITGIFTSIIASILHERWKLKRELNK
ncbi:restriction endonuclease [Flagellimonas sp.]|uniref:restriction endonuclease n=1 Tax=Flagellimonas sp. TaxID=2058762 RepID=UPI003AB4E55C